jgi:magnesium-transporting ATPase (P-type)
MRRLIQNNVTWLYGYFDRNKSLLEIFSFLMVAQSFIYSTELKDVSAQSINAFKIVLWIMIFLIILLLQVSTAVEIRKDDEHTYGTIFKGANFMKTVMRLLTLVLLVAAAPIFAKQIQQSLHNGLFSIFYGSLGLILIIELIAFGTAFVLRRDTKIKR